MAKRAKKQVNSVHRVFDLIEGLKELDGAGVTELAEHVDLPPSTVHNYLVTLQDRAFVVKSGDTYRLASRFAHVGDYTKYQHEVYRIGKGYVRQLAETTEMTVNLVIEENGRGVYVCSETGAGGLQNYSSLRFREYLHSTACGKAILSQLPESRVREILDEHGMPAITEHTITDREGLFEELETVAETGVAFNDEENTDGLRAVGAPIRLAEGSYGSISVSASISRLDEERFRNELADHVSEVAKSIEVDLV